MKFRWPRSVAPPPSYAVVARVLARAETPADRAHAARVLRRYYAARRPDERGDREGCAAPRRAAEPTLVRMVLLRAALAGTYTERA